MEEKKVTLEEFAKKYRELYDMSRQIEGINQVEFELKYYGTVAATQKMKALIDFETAESNLNWSLKHI